MAKLKVNSAIVKKNAALCRKRKIVMPLSRR